ncbi:MAG: DUF1016 family protein [Candidatus Delongbacteria bacterium]|nr:DUF1016 family protein [Candidatus Delongbacteria bacterium]
MNFRQLTKLLNETNEKLFQSAVKAVNTSLTIRNWLFGYYIVEFQQNGDDRAEYGKRLLYNLSEEIKIKGLTTPELSRCRQFYQAYPEILGSVTQELGFLEDENVNLKILGLLTQESNKPEIRHYKKLISSISYTHLVELIKIQDSLKRKFYELLCIKQTLSVRELKRQISTLSYERFGFSADKNLSMTEICKKIEPRESTDLVKSHYFFEFLKINNPSLIEETELESSLINHLQEFIIELGNGFCFEGRQKRILIGDEYYFIDLVFYHRILKCHVLIELKTDRFRYEHTGQLKTYLNYYKHNISQENDNPPVGILLVTERNKALVEYAIADSDKEIFVSKYKLQLPNKKEIEDFIDNELSKSF